MPSVRGFKTKKGRRKAAPLSSNRRLHAVPLPAYVTTAELARLLRVTMRRLALDASRLFPSWWPKLSTRSMKKSAFTDIKSTVLSYEDAAQLAALYRLEPTPRDLHQERADWAAKRPFGPVDERSRPAVISILGHKDHGKTTLLDKLRGGNVAAKEEFGITQETYAFNVNIVDPRTPPTKSAASSSSSVTPARVHSFSFLDTPGHVSFTEMRANVAAISDLILLVVAADEGVLDQTFETLRTARQLDRPLIVVINKCDLPGAADKVRQIKDELVGLGAKLHPPSKPVVSLHGDITVLETSALYDTTGFAELRAALLSVIEQLKPQTDVNAVPQGRVVEAMMARGRGAVIRVALTQGTLRVGQAFTVEGLLEGRVRDIRAMRSSADGEPASLASVGAGITVDVTGCVALPNPGAVFQVHESIDAAKLYAAVHRNEAHYQDQRQIAEHATQAHVVPRQVDEELDEVEEEEEYDEIEEVDELPEQIEAEEEEIEIDDEESDADDDGAYIDPADVPVDLDPRSRVAPPLPPRSSWELSPPPPPTQRALPIANLRPKFKYYSLASDYTDPTAESAASRQAVVQVESPTATTGKRFGLNILLKTANMGALAMLRQAIDDMNERHAARSLPAIHVAYAAAGDLTKKDLMAAEAEGCWVYAFRIARPGKPTIQQARERSVPLFAFRHHQHLLDHLQHHIEQSPELTETGEAKLDEHHARPKRRSHPSVR